MNLGGTSWANKALNSLKLTHKIIGELLSGYSTLVLD